MTNTNIHRLIEIFFEILKLNPDIDDFVYNEFSLQHELGIFLRQQLGHQYKVQFERNVRYFNNSNQETRLETEKKEIDIVIYNDNERYAIELKFPRNGQYPETMFSCIKDIKFMEEVQEIFGFTETFCVCLTNDSNFYEQKTKNDGIYQYFRKSNNLILGTIQKPTGDKNEFISLNRQHQIDWQELIGNYRHYIIKI